MATLRQPRENGTSFPQPKIRKQHTIYVHDSDDGRDTSPDPRREESGRTRSASRDDREIEDSVLEDMQSLEASFEGISRRYRLIDRIGEGMFSQLLVPWATARLLM